MSHVFAPPYLRVAGCGYLTVRWQGVSASSARNVRHVGGQIGELEHAVDEAQGLPIFSERSPI